MDLFSWLPVIIFIYAVATVFSSNNKKPQNRRPSNTGPQGPQRSRTPYSRQETKSTRPNWREMFEELERELFPKEEPIAQPSRPSTVKRYPSTTQDYRGEGTERVEGFATEGSWGTEGTVGVEGSAGSEGTFGREGEKGRESLGKPERKPNNTSPKPMDHERAAFPARSKNPLVQGVIWAEVLGKPRAYSKFSDKRRG
ncbi:MAG TPA: hypothetical protein GX523_05045 [Desulfitobacterium dehalogenans]|uniref:Collagen-like protein n=1 Tax=Desulfitobacterium dehalogenans TaxID=36854 RepID=A0A7C7D4R9_9FIRM|nr:hypothetical protein [Desulfitobacterium dehalogenans]